MSQFINNSRDDRIENELKNAEANRELLTVR